MTVSAAVRLSPSPQARVVIRRIRNEEDEEEDEEEEDEEEEVVDRPRLLLLFLSSSPSLSLSFPLLPSSLLWLSLWLWLSPLNFMAVSDRTLGGTDPSRRAYGTVGK